MSPHKQIYCDYYGYSEGDWFCCEYCGATAVDVHAIDPDGMGGSPSKKTHVIENLMAICREHHHQADHGTGLSKEFLKEVHLEFMVTGVPYLQR